MKSIFLFLFFISTISFCSQDDPNMKNEIIGNWKWLESSGGIAGKTETPASTGKEITIEFTTEKYIKKVNDLVETEMTYKIDTGKSIVKGENALIITYENGKKQSIELIENKLVLYDECYDCFQNEYIKE